MPEYRRRYRPGGVYFFTLVTHLRRPFLTTDLARECLRFAIGKTNDRRPFEMLAIVLLPDHLHTMWKLPAGDTDYSTRLRRMKEEFTRSFMAGGGEESALTTSRRNRQERGIWQPRFWEHTVDGEEDYARHFDYTHYNPVKHGLVSSPAQWPHSSFHRWVKEGLYDPDWGAPHSAKINFSGLNEAAME